MKIPPYLQQQYQLLQQQEGGNPLPYQASHAQSMGTPSQTAQAFQPPAPKQPQMLQTHQQHQVINPQNHQQSSNNVQNYAQANYQPPQQNPGGHMAAYPQPAPAQYGTPGGLPYNPQQQYAGGQGNPGQPSAYPGQALPGNPGYDSGRFPEFMAAGTTEQPVGSPGQIPATYPGTAQPVHQGTAQPPPGQPAPLPQYGQYPPGGVYQSPVPQDAQQGLTAPQGNTAQSAEIARLNQQIAETQQQLSSMGDIRNEVTTAVQQQNSQLRQQLESIQTTMAQQQAAQRASEAQAARARLAQNMSPEALADLDAYINNTVGPQLGEQTTAQTQQIQQQYDARLQEMQQQVQQAQQQAQQTQEQVARSRAMEMRTRLLSDHPDLDSYMKGANNAQWQAYLNQPIAPGSTMTRQAELDAASQEGNTQRISQMIRDYKVSSGAYYPPQQQEYGNGNGYNGNGNAYNGNGNPYNPQPAPIHHGYSQNPVFEQSPQGFIGQNPYQQVNPINQGAPVSPYVNPTGSIAPGQNGGFTNPQVYGQQQYTAADLAYAAEQVTKHSNDPQAQAQWSNKYNEIERFFTQQAGQTSILPPIN